MNRIIMWLETLTLEETFLVVYGGLLGIGMVMIPVGVWLSKKMCKNESEEDTTS